mgnify:CR=1 FL=1
MALGNVFKTLILMRIALLSSVSDLLDFINTSEEEKSKESEIKKKARRTKV